MQIVAITEDVYTYKITTVPVLVIPRQKHFSQYAVLDLDGKVRLPQEIRDFPYIIGLIFNQYWEIDCIELKKDVGLIFPSAHFTLRTK
jgi:hypothetical protein